MIQGCTNFLGKTIVTLSTAARTASCSHGWLRRVVEATFALLITASFVLILFMSIGSKPMPPPRPGHKTKCEVFGCRVICEDLNFEKESEHIIDILELADTACDRLLMTLKSPIFINSSIPPYWLSGARPNVMELAIINGNLQHISPQAFMTSFGGKIENLILKNVTISKLEPETLVGLSSINNLYIKGTTVETIEMNALYAIHDTLQLLTITHSGKWDPKYITGSSNLIKLVTVDLSYNYFGNVIGKKSFRKLKSSKVLYLNSCGIEAIGLGAFDEMLKIQNIYLNNNHLIQLPLGLFDKLIALPTNPKPKVNLQNNPWFCDCSESELKSLSSNGMLLLDVTCQHPSNVKGVSFLQNEKDCRTNKSETHTTEYKTGEDENHEHEKVYMNGLCTVKNDSKNIIWNYPIESLRCGNKIMKDYTLTRLVSVLEHDNSTTEDSSAKTIITPSFALKYGSLSMVEITSQELIGYGLVWYQSKCPRELYCVNKLPNFLRVYNLEKSSKYTFCPLKLSSGETEGCISYSLDLKTNKFNTYRLIFSVSLGVSCVIFGALFVYGLIRKYPTLLKGNDRILIVKHKSVDALILPPKVPLRTDDLDMVLSPNHKDNEIFFVHEKGKGELENNFIRTKSRKSGKSSAPTYISALEPTEDQLAEWRLRHHFDNISIATSSISLDVSTYSCNSDNKSLYYSVTEGTYTYENLNGSGRY